MKDQGFDENYWKINYEVPEDMDGIGNAKDHANYLKATFGIEYIDISSVIDFGFGMGELFKEVLKIFLPYRAEGIEPSAYIFKQSSVDKFKIVDSMNVKLHQKDLLSWCEENKDKKKTYDLGICTSVFQYLSEEEIDYILPILAAKVKYLYFSVPTNVELSRQRSELDFHDRYAIARTRQWYQKKIKREFTFVSGRILESKVHFNESNTFFTDLLYRF